MCAPTTEHQRNTLNEAFNSFRSKGLHFVGLNIRSLLPKIDQLKIFVQNNNPAVISVSETWLDNSVTSNEVNIPGYSIERKDRNRQGGGVCIYVRDNLSYNIRNDIDHENIEGIWIDLLLPKTRPILIGSIYRPPNQKDFLEKFKNISKQMDFTQETFIFGDINICMKNKNTNLYKRYLDILKNHGFTQIIKEPTRIENKQSIIDHIICSTQDKISKSGVLPIAISDHFATFCTRKIKKDTYNSHKTISARSMKKYSKESFCEILTQVDWSPVLSSQDANSAWLNFKSIFLKALDIIAPTKLIRIKQRSAPWITTSILEKIGLRDFYLSEYNKNKTKNDLKHLYCKLRNEIHRDINDAKSNYLKGKLEENITKPKNYGII